MHPTDVPLDPRQRRELWWFLAIASVGAVACLFFGLMLVAMMLRRLGITSGPPPKVKPAEGDLPDLPDTRPIGGRRAAR